MEVSLRRKCGGLLGPVEPDGASLGPLSCYNPYLSVKLILDLDLKRSR